MFVITKFDKMKQTICSLIQDDIRHTQLLNHLQTVGVEAHDYVLNVSETVFKLVDLRESPFEDIIVRGYFDLIKTYQEAARTPKPNLSLEQFTECLYAYLMSFSVRNG